MQRINASFAVGLNCPVSIELIVFLETPTQLDKSRLADKSISPYQRHWESAPEDPLLKST